MYSCTKVSFSSAQNSFFIAIHYTVFALQEIKGKIVQKVASFTKIGDYNAGFDDVLLGLKKSNFCSTI
jgi:hypothetical protein